MKRRPTHGFLALMLGGAVAVASNVGRATAQPPGGEPPEPGAQSVTLYDGQQLRQAGISVSGWGSGSATENRDITLSGDASIRIAWHGYYSGGRIRFQNPVDLSAQVRDRYHVILFTAQFAARAAGVPGSGYDPYAPGGPYGPGGPFGPGGSLSVDPNLFPAGGDLLQDPGIPFGPPPPIAASRRLRVVLVFREGTVAMSNFPLSLFKMGDAGWHRFAVPLAAFKGLRELPGHHLQEIRLFGDGRDVCYLGEIETRSDPEPIVVDPLDSGLVVAVNEPVEFVGIASAGWSSLHYSWDFDARRGATEADEDAVGPIVIHYFRKPSPTLPNGEPVPYLVRLTVSDVGGAKAPAFRECEVVVNP